MHVSYGNKLANDCFAADGGDRGGGEWERNGEKVSYFTHNGTQTNERSVERRKLKFSRSLRRYIYIYIFFRKNAYLLAARLLAMLGIRWPF